MLVNILHLNNKKISYKEIKTGFIVGDTPFEQSTLAFCRQWLNGQASFSLKTSGSTGKPKTIEVTRKQMIISAQQTIKYFNLEPVDTALVCLNTAYIAGIMMLVRALEAGAKIIAVEPSSNPLKNINDQIDLLAIVPMQLQSILADPYAKSSLEKCRSTIVGGAKVSYELQEILSGSTAKVYATFGMTETLTHFALKELNPTTDDYYTVLDDVTIGQDSRGCLTITGPVTGQKEIVTNDLVEIFSTKKFRWLGRIDNVINSGGIKLQIEEIERNIEKMFYELNLDGRFFVAAKPDQVLGEKVVLVIESNEEISQINQLDWSKYFSQYQEPKEVLYCQRFQETPTGKINRLKTMENL